MKIIEAEHLSSTTKARIVELWNNEYPVQLSTSVDDLDQYFNPYANERHFLLIDEKEILQGWAYTFNREDERWFSIILDGSAQGKGWGTQMMHHLMEAEDRLCGWVTDHSDDLLSNGEKYNSPLSFYEGIGFLVLRDIRFPGEILSAVKIVWVKKIE